MKRSTAIVIPCFNEEARLDPAGIAELFRDDDVSVVFVDDGSTDGTRALLEHVKRDHDDRIALVPLDRNVGKAEAVRAGLLRAVESGARVVGYLDADLATPPAEMLRIVDALRANPALSAAIGARIALLGARIERKASRHYLGRVFATAASMVLQVPVYDTQCGAKVFRVDDDLKRAIATPFTSKWVFDVELLDRLLDGGRRKDRIVEVPLHEWRDVRGSKLGALSMASAALDLAKIARRRRT